MCWPVGSNRHAKTSPEWPVSSMTGDCSALPPGPYVAYQHMHLQRLDSRMPGGCTYRPYECAILPRAIHYCYRIASQIRVRLCALDKLTCTERVVCGSLRYGHVGCRLVSLHESWRVLVIVEALVNFLEADLRQDIRTRSTADSPSLLHHHRYAAASFCIVYPRNHCFCKNQVAIL